MNKYSRQPGDSILALLEPGEYVLNRNAVNEIGKEKLDDLNYEDAPRFDMSQRGQFQAGGMLGEMMGMQAGGDTLSYGGATSETQSLDDIYKKMGMQPNAQQLSQFQEQYAYDPSREGVIFEDYGRAIQGATQSGQQNLMGAGQQMQQAQSKSGFADVGAGQQAQSQARDTIMQDFLAQEGAAKSSLFKGVRGEREQWMTDVGAGLGRLQSEEGTVDYGASDSLRGDPNESYVAPSDTSDQQYGDDLHSEEDADTFNPNVKTTESVTVDGVTWQWNPALGSYQRPPGDFSDKHLKENINLIGSSDNGVNIYTFEYKDKSYGDGLYKGVMAQEVPWASIMMNNGYLAVDYNKIDVDFKRIF